MQRDAVTSVPKKSGVVRVAVWHLPGGLWERILGPS